MMAQTGDLSLLRRPLTIRDMIYLSIAQNKIEDRKLKVYENNIKIFTTGVESVTTLCADIRKILFDTQLHFNSPGEAEVYRLTLPSAAGNEQKIQNRLIIGRSRGRKKTTPDKDGNPGSS